MDKDHFLLAQWHLSLSVRLPKAPMVYSQHQHAVNDSSFSHGHKLVSHSYLQATPLTHTLSRVYMSLKLLEFTNCLFSCQYNQQPEISTLGEDT